MSDQSYQLYICALQDFGEIEVKGYSFLRKGTDQVLIFGERNNAYTKYSIDEHGALTCEEKKWLFFAKMAENTKLMKEASDEYMDIMNNYLDALEKELLKAEKEEHNGK